MDVLERINLWFAMHEHGEATDERQLLNDAAEEIELLGDELSLLRRKVEHGCANFQCEECDD